MKNMYKGIEAQLSAEKKALIMTEILQIEIKTLYFQTYYSHKLKAQKILATKLDRTEIIRNSNMFLGLLSQPQA